MRKKDLFVTLKLKIFTSDIHEESEPRGKKWSIRFPIYQIFWNFRNFLHRKIRACFNLAIFKRLFEIANYFLCNLLWTPRTPNLIFMHKLEKLFPRQFPEGFTSAYRTSSPFPSKSQAKSQDFFWRKRERAFVSSPQATAFSAVAPPSSWPQSGRIWRRFNMEHPNMTENSTLDCPIYTENSEYWMEFINFWVGGVVQTLFILFGFVGKFWAFHKKHF